MPDGVHPYATADMTEIEVLGPDGWPPAAIEAPVAEYVREGSFYRFTGRYVTPAEETENG